MNTAPELIVTMEKAIRGRFLILAFLAMFFICSFFETYRLSFSKSFYGEKCIIILMIFFIVLMWISDRFFQFFKRFFFKEPVAILNKEGIWIYCCGLISWDNIAALEEYDAYFPEDAVFGGKMQKGLGILLKDPALVPQNSSCLGKIILDNATRPHFYHIALTDLDIECRDVIQFAQQFMEQ